jgi:hypothetical protein
MQPYTYLPATPDDGTNMLAAGWKSYVAPISPVQGNLQQTQAVAGDSQCQAAAMAQAIRQWLPHHLAGHWRMKFGCSQGARRPGDGGIPVSNCGRKCGCPFAITIVHEPGQDYALVSEVRHYSVTALQATPHRA